MISLVTLFSTAFSMVFVLLLKYSVIVVLNAGVSSIIKPSLDTSDLKASSVLYLTKASYNKPLPFMAAYIFIARTVNKTIVFFSLLPFYLLI